jgi:tetratricopeptide (TPR) repeat protein
MKYLLTSLSLFAILLLGTTQGTLAQDSALPLDKEKDVNELTSDLVLLLKENRFEEALPYLNKLLEFEPNNVSLLLNKGSVLIALDRSDESITYFDRVLKIEPNNINGLASKAAALSNLGETQNALDLYDKILSMEKNEEKDWNKKITDAKGKLLSQTPTISIHGSIGEDDDESKYDIHLRVTVRNPEGELVSVIESKSGRYMPVNFTDEVFDTLFEIEEVIEINGQKFEKATFSESYITDNHSIGSFFYEVNMNDYLIRVFEIFPPHVGVEPSDELYAEWTISRKL